MSLTLEALGRLDIHATASWSIPDGPRGTRSVTNFEKVIWTGPVVEAESKWANGTYLATEHVAEPRIRAYFETLEDAAGGIFLDYRARFRIDAEAQAATGQPTPGVNPVYLAGRIETADPRFAWLNATQIVGKGGFDAERLVLSYEIHALR
ncbi:MAG: DUF3237 family protein [Myxococcota bacterium]